MPPKKRNRQSSPPIALRVDAPQGRSSPPKDLWTDEQEAVLFKSMISWKPVAEICALPGMHKHFRMIAISESLRNHGYTSPQDAHTRPKGIWEKLSGFYNLEQLDSTEDLKTLGLSGDNIRTERLFHEFELPDEDYLDMTFARRLVPEPERPSSPPLLAYQYDHEACMARARQSTIDATIDEHRSSPGSGRGGRGPRSRMNRASQLADSARVAPWGSKVSVEKGVGVDTTEPDGYAMDIDAQETLKTPKTGANTRRSGRRR